jgi:hypothetical protein
MKRTALATLVAGLALALNAGIASAHGSFAFDDAYWKQVPDRTSVQQAEQAKSKYDLVDNYNY